MSETPDLFDEPDPNPAVYGCIEAGGTKFMLGVLSSPADTAPTLRVATTTPEATLQACLAFFAEHAPPIGYAAIGIASFGPVELDPLSPRWGRITETPKPGWRDTDMAGPFARAFDCPVGFDTDVNAAVLAEATWGAAQNVAVATYLTVGTGIGGGALVDGRPVHGHRHPEMGHFMPARHPRDDFAGSCPYHGACLEGLANGPAIMARWGTSLSELAQDHPAHEIVAFYLAQAVVAQQALLSPQRIVVEPGLGTRSGLLGALALAMAAKR